jgi:predicted small secreted protein
MGYQMKNVILAALLLAGCATNSGVIADGKDSYIVIVSGGHRFASTGDLKIEAYKDANAYCRKLDKQLESIAERTVQAGVLSNSSEVELKFKCISI